MPGISLGSAGSAGADVRPQGGLGGLAGAGGDSTGGVAPGGAGSAASPAIGGSGGSGGSGGAVLDAFLGAPAFQSAPVPLSALLQMSKSGTNPNKTQCLSCHTGAQGVTAFLAGGTVFEDASATLPAADYEVRVLDTATGSSYSAHTDENGNFWLNEPTQAVSGPFLIGVRNGARSRSMPILQRGLECNGSSCHGGMQGPVHAL